MLITFKKQIVGVLQSKGCMSHFQLKQQTNVCYEHVDVTGISRQLASYS